MPDSTLSVRIDFGDKHYIMQISHSALMHVNFRNEVEASVHAGVYKALLDFHGRVFDLQKENFKMRMAIMNSKDLYIRGELVSEGVNI